jgi:hypothetical protein
LRLRWCALTCSEIIDHLPERSGEVVRDGAALSGAQLSPDVARVDAHASSLSPARAINSTMVSGVSLVGTARRTGHRFVAGTGILNSILAW